MFFILIFVSCIKTSIALKKLFIKKKLTYEYYFVFALEGALLTFIVTMSFLDRHRAEILYWLILFFMAAHNIYINKSNSQEITKA